MLAAPLASKEIEDSSSLLDSRAKLTGDIGWAYRHHQSDFRIPEDCIGDYLCNQRLVAQNRNILTSFIMDALIYIAPNITENLVSTEFNYEDIYKKFTKGEELYTELSATDCELGFYCSLGSPCGRGDYGNFHACISDRVSERIKYLSTIINTGFAQTLKVIDKNITLDTESFVINIKGVCIPPAVECGDLEYSGKSKKNGLSMSLRGVPYYGRDNDRADRIKLLGYYFKNGNIEYYVSISGVLKVNNLESNKVLIEESGVWTKTP